MKFHFWLIMLLAGMAARSQTPPGDSTKFWNNKLAGAFPARMTGFFRFG
jgi:hypothetical protein